MVTVLQNPAEVGAPKVAESSWDRHGFVTSICEAKSDDEIAFKPISMMMKEERSPAEQELRIPMDLGEWVEAGSLREWVIEAIETLDWGNQRLQEYLAAHPGFHPKEMLSLQVYAYVTGVFESAEIVSACRYNEHFRALWKGQVPATKELGKFRKENRGLLKWGVAQVLRRAIESYFNLGDQYFPAGLRRRVVVSAVERLDLARQMDRAAQGA